MFSSIQTAVAGIPIHTQNIKEITCYNEAGRWYIHLVHFVKSKGREVCTEIAAFADDLLGWLARRRRAALQLHTLPFTGARELVLEQLCTGAGGGAFYRMVSGRGASRRLWVCGTSLLVFGDLPPRIFLKFCTIK